MSESGHLCGEREGGWGVVGGWGGDRDTERGGREGGREGGRAVGECDYTNKYLPSQPTSYLSSI